MKFKKTIVVASLLISMTNAFGAEASEAKKAQQKIPKPRFAPIPKPDLRRKRSAGQDFSTNPKAPKKARKAITFDDTTFIIKRDEPCSLITEEELTQNERVILENRKAAFEKIKKQQKELQSLRKTAHDHYIKHGSREHGNINPFVAVGYYEGIGYPKVKLKDSVHYNIKLLQTKDK